MGKVIHLANFYVRKINTKISILFVLCSLFFFWEAFPACKPRTNMKT